MSDHNITIHDQGDLARIADLNGLMDMMRENAVDREQRIAELEARNEVQRVHLEEQIERIAELELSNRCLEEGLAVMTKSAEDNGNAAMRADAERPEGPPNQHSKGWWTKTKPVNREGGEG